MQLLQRVSERYSLTLQQALTLLPLSSSVLLTSGGTSVPLQLNQVRSIQNFSTGQRGAQICQNLLQSGVHVIFLHRKGSRLPFFSQIGSDLLSTDIAERISQAQLKYQSRKQNLFLVQYQTVYEYLLALHEINKRLGKSCMMILAAAVSDYVPRQVSEHKISGEGLTLQLMSVPKTMPQLKRQNQSLFLVSFKLQTDQQLLQSKMRHAIQKYGADMVVGNLLQTRKKTVIVMDNKGLSKIQAEGKQLNRLLTQKLLASWMKFKIEIN